MARQDSESRRPFAKRSLGQNFLSDRNYVQKIVSAIDPSPTDIVIEIGPGRGALTELLVATGARTIAIELDRDLIPLLESKFGPSGNFQLVEADALNIDFSTLVDVEGDKLKLVANLPYYISTAILQRLIDQRDAFSELVLMFQREVVERMTAKPGDPERGFLSVLVEAFLDVKRLFDVPPSAFRPVPKVSSTVVGIMPLAAKSPLDEGFKELISHAFRQPRKTLFNNLKNVYPNINVVLSRCDVDPSLRPERLTQQQWKCICMGLRGVESDHNA
jgi:16S rRNA (adenine1518-N6/adenine1519-N6)-dimethyltransferase